MIVVITGNGRPFRRLVGAAAALASRGREVWVQHGDAELPSGLSGAALVPHPELVKRIQQAEAVVCHGGSGSIAEALEAGHIPVVMPRLERFGEHINDHQLDIAAAMEARRRAVVIRDVSEIHAAIARAQELSRTVPPLKRSGTLGVAVRAEIRSLSTASMPGRARVVWKIAGILGRLAPLREPRT